MILAEYRELEIHCNNIQTEYNTRITELMSIINQK